ncbi:MAG: hypothetical protein ACRC9H_17765 [Aeromonas veronii]
MSKLTVTIKVGETLRIGDTLIRLEKKSGQLAHLVIDADPGITITPPARKSASPVISERPPHGQYPV